MFQWKVFQLNNIAILFAFVFLGFFGSETSFSAEPADLFSRANCYNNESITYNYFDPDEWRTVISWHYLNGTLQHYVTENPPYLPSCHPGTGGNHQVNGLLCGHQWELDDRQAGVHGAFLSSEPNPDGDLTPGCAAGSWRTLGDHYTLTPGIGFVEVHTEATDCNAHPEQFY